jgi:hypothetical protein
MTVDFDKFQLKKISYKYHYKNYENVIHGYIGKLRYNHSCFCGGIIRMFKLTYFYNPKEEFSDEILPIEIKRCQSRCIDCGFRAPHSSYYVRDYDSEGNEVDYWDCLENANEACINILQKISCGKEIKEVLQKHLLPELEKDLKETREFFKEKIEKECQRIQDINDGKIEGLYGQMRQAVSRNSVENVNNSEEKSN